MAALGAIREAIVATVEDGIPTLKGHATIPAQVTGDAFIVRPSTSPTAEFDQAMGRGLDRWNLDLIVICPYGELSVVQARLDGYIDGGGDASIRKRIFSNRSLGLPDVDAWVSGVTAYGPREDASYDHLSATLRLTVYTRPA